MAFPGTAAIAGLGTAGVAIGITAFALLGTPNYGACGPGGSGGSGSGGTGQNNTVLFAAVEDESDGNNRKAMSMLFASNMESSWSNTAVGAGSYGPYQIQDPGEPFGPNPTISRAEAENPVEATKYMGPRFDSSLEAVGGELWESSPLYAAEQVAMGAERPAEDYIAKRGFDRVQQAFDESIAVLKRLKISTDFNTDIPAAAAVAPVGSRAPPTSQPAPSPSPQPSGSPSPSKLTKADICARVVNAGGGPSGHPVTGTGDSAVIAARLLKNPNLIIPEGSAVKFDLTETAAGRPINNKWDCFHDIVPDPGLLEVIEGITEHYKIRLNNIITSHDCDLPRFHPQGRATDIEYAQDLKTKQSTNFCSQSLPEWPCDTAGDNLAIDRGVAILAGTLFPAHGGGLGQSDCPGRANTPVPPAVVVFPDTCNHLHVDMRAPAAA